MVDFKEIIEEAKKEPPFR